MIGKATLRRAGATALTLSLAIVGFPSVAAAASSRADLNAVAKCAVSKDRQALARAVRALPLTSDPVTLGADQLGDAAPCLSSASLAGPSMIVRGAVAQAFYFADFREIGMEPRTPVRNLVDLGWPPIKDEDPVTDPGIALFKLGDCIARNQAENVDKLMRAEYGSAQAKKLLDLMTPYYTACYPKGAEISASRDGLHSAIAQGAYYAGVRYWTGQLNFVQQKNGR